MVWIEILCWTQHMYVAKSCRRLHSSTVPLGSYCQRPFPGYRSSWAHHLGATEAVQETHFWQTSSHSHLDAVCVIGHTDMQCTDCEYTVHLPLFISIISLSIFNMISLWEPLLSYPPNRGHGGLAVHIYTHSLSLVATEEVQNKRFSLTTALLQGTSVIPHRAFPQLVATRYQELRWNLHPSTLAICFSWLERFLQETRDWPWLTIQVWAPRLFPWESTWHSACCKASLESLLVSQLLPWQHKTNDIQWCWDRMPTKLIIYIQFYGAFRQ